MRNSIEHKYWLAPATREYISRFFPIGLRKVRELLYESCEIETVVIFNRRHTWKEAVDAWLLQLHNKENATMTPEEQAKATESATILFTKLKKEK